MSEKSTVRFEEAERNRSVILTSIAVACASVGWLCRGSIPLMSVVALVGTYLMTGDRYQWVYIWKKTHSRDFLGLRVLLVTMFKIWWWEKQGKTVVTRWEEVAKWSPEKKAFVMGDRALTFREGDEFSNRVAWYFKRQGFKSGEVIALFMETQPEYVFLWLGLAKLRVITALVNTNLRGSQLIHCLRIAGCKAVVFGDEMTEAIKDIQVEIRDMPLFQFNSPERSKALVLHDTSHLAAELDEMAPEPFTVVPSSPKDTLLYIYTSGTTGFPKAAIITNIRFLYLGQQPVCCPIGTCVYRNTTQGYYGGMIIHQRWLPSIQPCGSTTKLGLFCRLLRQGDPGQRGQYCSSTSVQGRSKRYNENLLTKRYLLIPLGVHTSARLTPADVIYDPLPLHHTAGGVLGAGQAIVLGCTVVLRKKFSASNYWSDVKKHGCTAAQYIGEICRYLLSVPPGPNDRAHNVKVIVGNGLRPQIWQEFVERFSVKRVLEFYGATEGNSNLVWQPYVGCSVAVCGLERVEACRGNTACEMQVNLDSKVGAIGFLSRLVSSIYPLTLVKCDEITGEILRDGNGRCITCGPHEPGLLLGKIDPKKAILTFAGYADKTASEKKMVRDVRAEGDCYFNTGDILVMDHFGYFYFKDRTGDTFRWRGENVSTTEVEGVISNLIGLKDAVVYGVAVPNVEGKAGMAAIADPEKKLDLPLLAKGLKTTLPAYARPLFIRILPEPPLTATFKLKKKELLEQGYNPKSHNDPMYFLDQKSGEYVPFTQKLYDDLVLGTIRL